MSNRSDETLTASDMTPAEAAAWEVAVSRGLNITRLDLRYLLEAADRGEDPRDAEPPRGGRMTG